MNHLGGLEALDSIEHSLEIIEELLRLTVLKRLFFLDFVRVSCAHPYWRLVKSNSSENRSLKSIL